MVVENDEASNRTGQLHMSVPGDQEVQAKLCMPQCRNNEKYTLEKSGKGYSQVLDSRF